MVATVARWATEMTSEILTMSKSPTSMAPISWEGLFSGLAHEDPHKHLRNIVGVCGPFSFKNISQESVRLRLFSLSLMVEACKWLAELPRESIISWEELVTAFQESLCTKLGYGSKSWCFNVQPMVCLIMCYFSTFIGVCTR
ncbi:hypothetical protein MTR67_034782 [Solanum verrucosum]|uniref:Retrotransposon gag domain-containing protein n=1 Tax=Solanum verrucosum TaxID=315347 RepID=A0AAF0U8S0_SOLVR|nr:hypothetical protein MTR67_034782 [Solanum verrucosum]